MAEGESVDPCGPIYKTSDLKHHILVVQASRCRELINFRHHKSLALLPNAHLT